ncbi:hypothetical protein FACS189496_5220 [Bacilli bacterium]|nr:hypothetical protein FACS189496_5220 [Bacilli bacterium]
MYNSKQSEKFNGVLVTKQENANAQIGAADNHLFVAKVYDTANKSTSNF